MITLSRLLSLFTTRNSISPSRSSWTAGYAEVLAFVRGQLPLNLGTHLFRKGNDVESLLVFLRRNSVGVLNALLEDWIVRGVASLAFTI